MKQVILNIRIGIVALLFFSGALCAQSLRSSVNKGVNLYKKGQYVNSEVEFRKGLEKSADNFQANFDLGDSYYKEGKYDDALRQFSAALSQAPSNRLKADVYHNIGNSLLQQQKVKPSIDAYINALKLNPNDEATKYNLSYALSLLKNQNKQNQNKNKQDKNNQDKNNKNQNDNKNQNKNQQNQNQKNNQQNQNNQNNQQNQSQQNQMSKDQAQAIFNALNHDEKDLQKQLRKMTSKPVKMAKDW